jgi:hypothetical protein
MNTINYTMPTEADLKEKADRKTVEHARAVLTHVWEGTNEKKWSNTIRITKKGE